MPASFFFIIFIIVEFLSLFFLDRSQQRIKWPFLENNVAINYGENNKQSIPAILKILSVIIIIIVETICDHIRRPRESLFA